jgi:hypothetical protein
MRNFISRAIAHPALALGNTILSGFLEFIALQRLRLGKFGAPDKRRAH